MAQCQESGLSIAIWSEIKPLTPGSGARGFDERGNPDKIDPTTHVVGKGSQAELTVHVLKTPHKERPLSHPLLDGAEWMLHALPTAPQHVGARSQATCHPVDDGLVHVAHDASIPRRGAVFPYGKAR